MLNLGLENKIVLITGSTRGLGKAMAEKFAEEKAIVIVTGTNQEKASATANLIATKYRAETEGFQLDVTDEDSVKEVVREIIKRFGRIDVLINNRKLQLQVEHFGKMAANSCSIKAVEKCIKKFFWSLIAESFTRAAI